MGLDMYLNAKRFLCHDEEEIKKQVGALLPDAPGEVKRIEVEAAYWRKANQIHAWFVHHVQKDNDDCGDYDVSREKMQALANDCKAILDNPTLAPALLPTQAGFFFGGTEYDESYTEDLQYTYDRLTALLARDPKEGKWSYEYHSSW